MAQAEVLAAGQPPAATKSATPAPARPAGRSATAFLTGSPVGRMLLAIALPILILVLWQLAGRGTGSLFGGVLPTPDRVWDAWKVWAFGQSGLGLNPYSGTWASNVMFSAQRVGQGFALATLVGIPLGILIGWNRLAAGSFDPLIQMLRPIPITAWLPFSIAVFGIQSMGAVFLIALGAFYPIVINATAGARGVEKNWIRAALMMGARPMDILLRVVLPASLPSIFTGLRIGLGIGWTAVIVAEMVAVKSGLGYVLWDAYYIGRMDVVIADMASIGLLGFLSDRLILFIEHWLLGWRRLSNFQN
ncbi:ABC transporter permease [Enterovirga sp. CN4-39]|uniref:ABC transporter permease n=1 Tax=Enterovirga sp. CN4-39 TaxID=3400910 RepID=UPI003C01A203